MVFKQQTCSVLVVSATGKFTDVLNQLLSESEYAPVTYASSVAAARRLLLDRVYDFVIINAPLSDELGTKLAIDVCRSNNMVALLLVKHDIVEETNAKVVPYGVFTLSKPTAPQALVQGLQWMRSARERLRGFEKKSASMDEKMEEIRLVNRAKWLLIEKLTMTESDAHRYIEKQAMDQCVSRREIANGIIQTYT